MPEVEYEDWVQTFLEWYDRSRITIIDFFDVAFLAKDIEKLSKVDQLEKLVIWMPPIDPQNLLGNENIISEVLNLLKLITCKPDQGEVMFGGVVSIETDIVLCHKDFSEFFAYKGINMPSAQRIKWQGRMPWAGPTVAQMDERPRTKRSWSYLLLAPILSFVFYIVILIGALLIPGIDYFYWPIFFMVPVVLLTCLANIRRRLGAHGQPFGVLTALIALSPLWLDSKATYDLVVDMELEAELLSGEIIMSLCYAFWIFGLIWIYGVPTEEGLGVDEAAHL